MKRVLALFLILMGVFTLTACSGSGVSKTKDAQRTITIGVLQDVDSIPFIIAANKGYFEKEGVRVKLEHFKSAKDRDSALQSGKIDGAIADILTVLFDKQGGFDVKITSKTDGSFKLLAGKNSGINSLKDIKGKSIAISKNTLIEYSTDRILKAAKYTDKDIQKEIIPQMPLRLEMLQNGKVDAATLPDPLASVALKNGAKLIYSTQEIGIEPGIIMFTAKVIKENHSDIEAIYRAYNEGADYLNNHPASSYVDVLIKDAGFPESIKNSIKLDKYTKAGMTKESDFLDVLDWMKSRGLIKESYEFKDVIDDSFVR